MHALPFCQRATAHTTGQWHHRDIFFPGWGCPYEEPQHQLIMGRSAMGQTMPNHLCGGLGQPLAPQMATTLAVGHHGPAAMAVCTTAMPHVKIWPNFSLLWPIGCTVDWGTHPGAQCHHVACGPQAHPQCLHPPGGNMCQACNAPFGPWRLISWDFPKFPVVLAHSLKLRNSARVPSF